MEMVEISPIDGAPTVTILDNLKKNWLKSLEMTHGIELALWNQPHTMQQFQQIQQWLHNVKNKQSTLSQ